MRATASTLGAAVARFRFAPILTAIVLTVLLLWLFGKAAEVFLLLFLAILFSLYLGAVADALERRFHIPGRMAFLIALFATLGAAGGLLYLLVPPVIEQTQSLVTVLPKYLAEWEAGIGRFMSRFPQLAQFWRPEDHRMLAAVYDEVSAQFSEFVPKVVSVVHFSINLFSVGVMSIYLALYPDLYREWLIALFPPIHRDLVRDVLSDLANQLRSYIVGQLTAMLVLAVFTAIGLYILRVQYALTFGIFTGAVAIIPFFGTLVSTVLPALFVLAGNGVWGFTAGTHAMLVILLGVVVHLVESNVVIPLITANRVHLPPVLTIMSVLIVGKLLGGFGLIVAVPLLTVLMVIVRRILVNRIYEGQGFRRTARDRTLVLRVPAPAGGVLVPDGPPPDMIALAERAMERKSA